ncbi:MAG: tRNA 4-thiouridine(8) synthase ThiI [Ureaplasma sp.]|nr:tRNA 4-thiouridine(8) synthase ThiI [Ureaplasma sp.]
MQTVIYLKYAELTLKKKNRNDFIKLLNKNTKYALSGIKCEIKLNYDYGLVYNFDFDKLDEIISILKDIPGYQYLTVAEEIGKSWEKLEEFILNNISNFEKYKTFKVEAKRQDKNFYLNSMEIKQRIGSLVLKNLDKKIIVDVKNPQLEINVEVKHNAILIFYKKVLCTPGLPVGSAKRIIVLLSGGLDSPVASKLLLNRGSEIIFLTFITPPHTCSESLDKIKKLSSIVTNKYKNSKNSKLLICNYTQAMHEISHISNESYKITLMRRSFIRIALKVAKKYDCHAIATGEAIGQVASQTIESLEVINHAANGFLMLRPLIGFDKNTIIDFAKKFDTYETSILNFPDSCSLFAPKNPVTKPKLEIAKELESELELLESIENRVFENIEEWKDD